MYKKPVLSFFIYKTKGVSLISLLVGLVISMLAALAGLSLFQSTAKTTVDAKKYSKISMQNNAMLLTIPLSVQSAGFGIPEGVWGKHAALLKVDDFNVKEPLLSESHEVSEGNLGNAFFWMEYLFDEPENLFDEPENLTCSALIFFRPEGVQEMTEVHRLGPVECGENSNFGQVNWKKNNELKAQSYKVEGDVGLIWKLANGCRENPYFHSDVNLSPKLILSLKTLSKTLAGSEWKNEWANEWGTESVQNSDRVWTREICLRNIKINTK